MKDIEDSGILDIDPFRDLTTAAKDRLLRKALLKDANRRLPVHKRDKDEDDPATDEQDREREKAVEMHQNRGKPAPVPVTDEDFPDDVADDLPRQKKGKK